MIQVMGQEGLEELEGIKFAKFLKRATGSKRMSSALLKTSLLAAAAGGAYYANKKYNLTDKLKRTITRPAAKSSKSGGVNTALLRNVIDDFLKPTTQISQPTTANSTSDTGNFLFRLVDKYLSPEPKIVVQKEPVVASTVNTNMVLALGAIGLIGFLLLRKK